MGAYATDMIMMSGAELGPGCSHTFPYAHVFVSFHLRNVAANQGFGPKETCSER